MRALVSVTFLLLASKAAASVVSTTNSPEKVSTPQTVAEDGEDESRFEEPVVEGRHVIRTLGRETAHKPTDHDLKMKQSEIDLRIAAQKQKPLIVNEASAPMNLPVQSSEDESSIVVENIPQKEATEPPAQKSDEKKHATTSDAVPERYSGAINLNEDESAEVTSLIEKMPVSSPSYRGATRQFGQYPEVEPFTPQLLLKDAQDVKTYEGYKVYRVKIESRIQERFIADLDSDSSKNVTLWEDPIVDRNVTLSAPGEAAGKIEMAFKEQGLKYKVLTDNLKNWIDAEKADSNSSLLYQLNKLSDFRLDAYNSFDNISLFLDLLAQEYPRLVKPVLLGYTYENNPIKGIVISTGGSKRALYIDAGTHAREWLPIAAFLQIIDRVVKNASTDPDVKSLLDRYELHFVPVINPDGYKYTWSGNRLWRKNRVRFQGFSWCAGVDPNRNFGYYFGAEGSSANPCSDVYRGSAAFSEQESRAVRNYITDLKDRLDLYLSLHAYGQYLLLPYGAGPTTVSASHSDLMTAAEAFSDAIQAKSGLEFTVGASKAVLYGAGGLSNDWAHSVGIKHAYVAEVRDKGTYGFIMPPKHITPSAEETFEGIKALVNTIYSEKSPKENKKTS